MPLLQNRLPMNPQRPRKCFDRGKETLLEAADQQSGSRLHSSCLDTEALLTQLPILVEKCNQAQFRSIAGQIFDFFLYNMALWESPEDLSEVVLEPTNHYIVQHFLGDLDSTAEPLRVEYL